MRAAWARQSCAWICSRFRSSVSAAARSNARRQRPSLVTDPGTNYVHHDQRKSRRVYAALAGFRGFSILFDSPGDCLIPSGNRLDLACNVNTDPSLGFYRGLRDALGRFDLDLLTSTYLFCPLPSPSYHVTVWDGGNDGNAGQAVSDKRPALEQLLRGLPDSLAQSSEWTEQVNASPLVSRRDWNIGFQFAEIAIWSNVVLVARLSPVEASQEAFEQFVEDRRWLNTAYFETFGIRASENYTPHVSLGYFANRQGAKLATPRLPEWRSAFAERMRGLTVSFRQASLYGFTDMANFFQAAGHH